MGISREKLKRAGRENVIGSLHDNILGKRELVEVAQLSIGKPIDMKMNELEHFSKHTYKINPDKVEEYKQSIEDYGLFTPLIVRDKRECESGKYEILAGHHRYEACKLLNWETIPVIIKSGISDAKAKTIANQTNMMQRAFELLTFYEKAESINQMKMASDELENEEPELREKREERASKEKDGSLRNIGRQFGVSKTLVSIYLTLYNGFNKNWFNYMEDTKEKKKLFDSNVAVILCKIPKKFLKELFDFVEDAGVVKKISKQQANELVSTYEEKKELNNNDLNKILVHSQLSAKNQRPISFKRELIQDYFDEDATEEEIMQEILELIREKKGLL